MYREGWQNQCYRAMWGGLLGGLRKISRRLVDSWVIKTFNWINFFQMCYFPIFLHLWNGDFPHNLWHFTITSVSPVHAQLARYSHWCSHQQIPEGPFEEGSKPWLRSEAFYCKLIQSKLAERESSSLKDFGGNSGAIFKEMLYPTIWMAHRKIIGVCKKDRHHQRWVENRFINPSI